MRAAALALVLAAARAASAADAGSEERDLRLLDLSADVLEPGKSEFGVFWGRYTRGVAPGLQLSTHVLGDLGGFLNVSAKYRFLDRQELRLSAEAGLGWPAILTAILGIAGDPFLNLIVPVELRATVPLADRLELDLAWGYRGVLTTTTGFSLASSRAQAEASLVRYDRSGAWILTGRFPLFSRSDMTLDSLLGKSNVSGVLALDDLPSWSLIVSRDQTFRHGGHARFGIGWRNTPGVILFESIGHVVLVLDLYWR